jgi:hypothetical protein
MIINRAEQEAQPFLTGVFKVPEKYADLLKDYQSTWERLTGFEFSGLHWRQFIVIYVNKNSDVYHRNYAEYVRLYLSEDTENTKSEFQPYEEGTIFLKEHYNVKKGVPKEPLTITMMIKHPAGYDPQRGDWEYVQFDASGNILMNGPSAAGKIWLNCAECHSNMKERDYIFSTYSNRRPEE